MDIKGGQLERGSVVGGYRIDGVISRGGMGVLYRVTNVALRRVYALKTLAPELTDDEQFRERFKREMRIAASIQHPNVVSIHYAGEHEGMLFLVMDFVYGSDLRRLLEEGGALEPERAVDLLEQFAAALDAAHAKGLVHRDVKPANMLITVRDGEEHGYLTDFGVAKRADNIGGMTSTGAVVGTVHYMAPEQITGDHTDARTDIYALACVFFQMLTGKVPYERENSIATLFAHVNDPAPPLPDDLAELYPAFGPIIEKAMAKSPSDRYLSAGDFARDAACARSGTRYTGPATVVATGDARPLRPSAPQESFQTPEATAPAQGTGSVSATHEAPSSPGPQTRTPRASEPGPLTAFPPGSAEPKSMPGAPARRPLRYLWPVLGGVLVAAIAIVAILVLGSGGSATQSVVRRYAATERPVPDNRVTGSGSATVQLDGNLATVTVDTNGLLPGAHLMHIHGGTGNCPPPSAAQLYHGHRFISASVGDQYYGPVVASLTQIGDTSPASHLAASRFPQVGNIRYKRTLRLGPGVAQDIRNGFAVIVVHGINYDGRSIYDNYLGPGVEAAAPALCGALFPTTSAAARRPGARRTTYTASLRLSAPPPGLQSLASLKSVALFWCHGLGGATGPGRVTASGRRPVT